MSNPTPASGPSDRAEADAVARDAAARDAVDAADAGADETVASDSARSHEEAGHTAVIPPSELPAERSDDAQADARAAEPVVVPPILDEPDLSSPAVSEPVVIVPETAPSAPAAREPLPVRQAWSEPSDRQVDDEGTPTVASTVVDDEQHPYPAAAYAPVPEAGSQPLTPAQQQFPLFVQAPEAPRDRGNRGFGILIGLLGTIVFAAIYAAAVTGLQLVYPNATVRAGGDFVDILLSLVTSWVFIVPVVVFFFAWMITAVIINRAGWVHWVLGGFVIGLVTYLSWFGGFLLQEQAWKLGGTASLKLVLDNAFAFGPVIAFVVAREIPVWLGGWIGAHGRRVRAQNLEAQREYEQVLDAGPTVAR
ncbi:hypothetical protein [Plantibacter sp. YIM 135249]|uniref:hypothetical protein n=1 Tax=Plantibacter sp. YIM 135249 TaxID=3423918 RepID=UPI003D34C925